jgi:hypothetical protein
MQSGSVLTKFAGAQAALALCTCSTGAIAAMAQDTSPDPLLPAVEPAPPPVAEVQPTPPPVAEVAPPPPTTRLPVQEVLPPPPVAPPPVAPLGGGGIGASPLLLGLGALVGAGLL